MKRSRQEPLRVAKRRCICEQSTIHELPWATRKTRGQATRPAHNAAAHMEASCPHSLLMQTTWLTMRETRSYANRGRRAIPRASYSAA